MIEMQNEEFIELAKLLIKTYDTKLLNENKELLDRVLKRFDKETVESLLFEKDNNGVRFIDDRTLKFLRDNNFDMKDISFDNVRVNNHSYLGLKNVTINIDKVVDKDISNTILSGVRLLGNLDNAVVNGTNFTGYIGKLVLNPQKVRNKDLSITNLDGIMIDGIFDGCDIFSTSFKNAIGGIYINPQKIKNKDLSHVDLDGVVIVGDNGRKPSFKGCKIKKTSFKGAEGIIEINPQELDEKYIMYCNFDGVTFTGGFENLSLLGNEFKGSENAVIDLNKVRDANIITKRVLDEVDYIPLEKKEAPKSKVLSMFKRSKI